MERPILFSTPMVQAILGGRKTQTRRMVKKIPSDEIVSVEKQTNVFWEFNNNTEPLKMWTIKCPYGEIGDILWVREAWRPTTNSMPIGWPYDYRATAKEDGVPEEGPWKPSIFMPKEACRISLEIISIRVERLQDISEMDSRAEGVESVNSPEGYYKNYYKGKGYSTARDSYISLWNKINGNGSWDKNLWVWVIEFKKL